jgi:hypothetical protein
MLHLPEANDIPLLKLADFEIMTFLVLAMHNPYGAASMPTVICFAVCVRYAWFTNQLVSFLLVLCA